MFPFDVILFDVGGVLLTNGWDHRERALAWNISSGPAAFEARHPRPTTPGSGRDSVKAYLDATVFYEPRSFSQRRVLCFHADPVEAACRMARWESLKRLRHRISACWAR